MADKLTPQQKQAVEDRGGKLLVSAAAGSGKTKVLVDRMLSYIADPVHPANLDDFLVITYTKAAAAELRGKIANKLSEVVSNSPNNRHLQQQFQRLYLTKISTVHAFCADILREYAYMLDIPVDFRVAEEQECLELQLSVIDKILDEAYASADSNPDFRAFVDSQGFGRNDRQLPEIILKLFYSARCHMNPEDWLEGCIGIFNMSHADDVSETVWAKYLIEDLHSYLDMHIHALTDCAREAEICQGMDKPVQLLRDTVSQLEMLRSCTKWEDIISHMAIDFGKLTFPRKNLDTQMAERVKAIREACKKGIHKKLRRFTADNGRIAADICQVSSAIRGLVELTRQFISVYDKLKQARRIMDFSDLEHKMLDLLLGKRRYGPTAIAHEIGQRFREVMVDEYQDSNEVQDAIFAAITGKRQNCFMVGDVKQSIYQFRLADPGIFLEKYNSYVMANDALQGMGRKVLLSNNFRSTKPVIDAVNDVFSFCMSPQVGGLSYGSDERLYEGIAHLKLNEPAVELYGLCVNDATYEEEASFVAERVLQLLDGTHMIRHGDTLRPICPEDIAILLRSPGSIGSHYAKALAAVGIPCVTGNTKNLLETEEVQTFWAMLQVIDNPLQDIPLIAVLTSKIFGFTADELAVIRSEHRKAGIYSALKQDSSKKVFDFLTLFDSLRVIARTNSLSKLLKCVLSMTGMDSVYSSMEDGENRIENILSFFKIAADYEANGGKGLNRFLMHLSVLEEQGLAAATEENTTGAVTIMSIHKSKGLEFPVVFLPALSRSFNHESAYAQMLCDKDLGLGLSCVDKERRVRYPSIAKNAISVKMLSEGLSEEMRVLYVAMTRARDRLIMSYSAKNFSSELRDLALRMDYTDPVLLASEADCPGKWILMSALKRLEAGAFFALAQQPKDAVLGENPWKIKVISYVEREENAFAQCMTANSTKIMDTTIECMKKSLQFKYPYMAATRAPSKQTATQLKGRQKDSEAAEHTGTAVHNYQFYRKPSFVDNAQSSVYKGTVTHAVMQYLNFSLCTDTSAVIREIQHLYASGQITMEQAEIVEPEKIANFFKTNIGKRLMTGGNILREFKFSVLDDAAAYVPGLENEQILLQGVVDCALIEEDGITVVDFKTDKITQENLQEVTDYYSSQVIAYGKALSKIYGMPIKSRFLYFFALDKLVAV